MANRRNITELDFDSIKNNLKLFLKQQNEFTDYDFEGSGLNILLDILAYNTHYQAFYLNMVANEAFLDTALLRDSVVSHAKSLGYTPYSKKSPTAIINLEAVSASNTRGTLTLPRGFSFLSNQIDGKSYRFILIDDATVTKSNSSYIFENLEIHEGQLASYSFNYDQSSNPKQFFILPDDSIDTTTLKVSVAPAIGNTTLEVYTMVNDILDVNNDSKVFFIQEYKNGKYQIYFGNDIVGKSLPDGAVVYTNYLVTNADASNKSNNFIATASSTDSLGETITNYIINPISAATGGSDRETIDSIKMSAPSQFSTQNRLVTTTDYESYIMRTYPNIDSVSIWGGEDEIPKVFGKVFISMKPKNNYYISEVEKQRIIDDILGPKSIVSISTEIRDPDYLYILISVDGVYNPSRTLRTKEEIKSSIRNAILLYRDTNLNNFKSSLMISKLQEQIDDANESIIGNHTTIRVQKRFTPVLGSTSSYIVRFNNSIHRGTSAMDRVTSTQFSVYDLSGILRECILEEVPQSYTGLSSIYVVNAGYGYINTPTVTITGDGTGAEAIAKIVNGSVESIEITNRGIDYTKATVTITGDGFGAEAIAVIDSRMGTLRTIYYNSLSERKIVNSNAGTIDYDEGTISINDINIIGVLSDDGCVRITGESQSSIIESVRNTILTIDEEDVSSIDINLEQV